MTSADQTALGISTSAPLPTATTQAFHALAGSGDTSIAPKIAQAIVKTQTSAGGGSLSIGDANILVDYVNNNGAPAFLATVTAVVSNVARAPATSSPVVRSISAALGDTAPEVRATAFLNFGPSRATEKGRATAAGSGAFGDVGPGGGEGLQMWAKALGSEETQDRMGSYQGYDTRTKGMTGGITSALNAGTQVGVAFSFNESKAVEKLDSVSSTDSQSYMLALYGALNPQNTWFADGSVLLGLSQNKSARLDFSRTLYTKSAKSYTGGVNGRLGYNVKPADERLNVKPFLAAQFSLTHTPESIEGGGNLPITLRKDNQYSAQLGFGTSISYALTMNEDWRALPEVSAQYMHEFNGKSRIVDATWLGQTIGISTPELGTEVVNLGVGVKMKSRGGVSLSFDYTATLKNKYVGHTGFVKFSYGF